MRLPARRTPPAAPVTAEQAHVTQEISIGGGKEGKLSVLLIENSSAFLFFSSRGSKSNFWDSDV